MIIYPEYIIQIYYLDILNLMRSILRNLETGIILIIVIPIPDTLLLLVIYYVGCKIAWSWKSMIMYWI